MALAALLLLLDTSASTALLLATLLEPPRGLPGQPRPLPPQHPPDGWALMVRDEAGQRLTNILPVVVATWLPHHHTLSSCVSTKDDISAYC